MNVIAIKDAVFDFLCNNAKALKYYQGKHLFTTIDELTERQIIGVYVDLKKHGKL